MILQDSQRGGAKNLALHLLKDENDFVEVHELRGFVSHDLVGALNEIYAISRGTRAKKFLYAVSFNPPANENVSTDTFISAVNRVESKMGLDGQPRAVVFHEKAGRRHAHVCWSRINADEMTAIALPFTKLKLKDISRELFIENGWKLPRGFASSEEANPLNYSLAQWQQAKRRGKTPKVIKQVFLDCWAMSETRTSFAKALESRGYRLARGDRRGFVAVDFHGEVFAISKWCGVKAKAVREKLGDPQHLPSVDEAKASMSAEFASHLDSLQKQQSKSIANRLTRLAAEKSALIDRQGRERASLLSDQQMRMEREIHHRQQRLSGGFRGLLERISGQRAQTIARNEREAYEGMRRDQHERDALIFAQLEVRRRLERRIERLRGFEEKVVKGYAQELAVFRGGIDSTERLEQGHAPSL